MFVINDLRRMTTYRSHFMKRKSNISSKDEEFLNWMDSIEDIVKKETNCYLHDMPDMSYYVSFGDSVSAESMAQDVINNFNKWCGLF